MRKNFHALRVAGLQAFDIRSSVPVVVYLNHASWWDPMLGFVLHRLLFPGRCGFAPIDAAALKRYRFLGKLGLFGVEQRSVKGARGFFESARAICATQDTVLWITPQGKFVDPRARPVTIERGLADLVASLGEVVILPLAVEYPFWEERFPEALAYFGHPVHTLDATSSDSGAWRRRLAADLEGTQDRLAVASMQRAKDGFETLVSGRAGVGTVYDGWRWIAAKLRGRDFSREHGAEGNRSGDAPKR